MQRFFASLLMAALLVALPLLTTSVFGQPPREVHYGEGTADEMCIGTLAVMNP
jgi:hypothetical protein